MKKSGRSSLQTNPRPAAFLHPPTISRHPNASNLNASLRVDGQSGQSLNGHPSNSSMSASMAAGMPNEDVEKQLPRANQVVDVEVGPSHRENTPSHLDQYADFWNVYNKEADREDNELISSFAGDLDTLLIFAGLFSATNTAFIVESYKDLKQDSSDLTNKLLRNVIRTMHQSSFSEADLLLDYAGPPARAIAVNLFFFASLCCSLFTAFGAVIGKQWLNHYGRESQLLSPSARGIERQRKYIGLATWKFQAVVETLPTLLQFSLYFFFIGLINFLWPLNSAVGILILLLSVLTLLFYVVTLFIGVRYPNSPFHTRLTNVMRTWLIPQKATLVEDQNREMGILRARCVDWLQQRTTFSETIGIISRAVTLLTHDAKKAINLDRPGAMLAYILRSTFSSGRVYIGISVEGLQSSLVALKDVVFQWDKANDTVHSGDTENTTLLRTLNKELWELLVKSGTMDEVASSAALAILEKLGPINRGRSRDSRATYLIQSLAGPVTREDQLIRLALLHDALWSEGVNWPNVGPYVAKRHMREVLATTMWGVDEKPDLDHRRVALRLAWFMQDTDGIYPHIQGHNLGLYLSLWRKSDAQTDLSISAGLGLLYLQTVMRLLLCDQDRWAKELDEHGHLTHIESITSDELLLSNTQFLTFILFAYIAGQSDGSHASDSPYYSQARVDRVVLQLHSINPSWIRFIIGNFQPNHVDPIKQSFFGYIETAYRHKRISDNEYDSVSQRVEVVMDYLRDDTASR